LGATFRFALYWLCLSVLLFNQASGANAAGSAPAVTPGSTSAPYAPQRLPVLSDKDCGITSCPYTPTRLPELPHAAPAATVPKPAAPRPKQFEPYTPSDFAMRFAIVRNASPSCEPLCPEWISASGTIMANSPSKLRKVLKKLGNRKLPIIIDSNGGNVDAAMEIGRMIRKSGLNVSVGSTSFTLCRPDQKGCKSPYQDGAFAGYSYPGFANCLSACPFILAGGTKRAVSLWSQVGVHQITTTVTEIMTRYETTYRIVKGKRKTVNMRVLNRKTTASYTTTKLSKSQRTQIDGYFIEMGIDKTLVARMLAIPASDIVILSADELQQYGLATERGDLAAIGNCELPSRFENCVLTQLKKVQ
jgi:hypothetical protein